MATYDRLASLPLVVEGYALEGLARTVSSGFERLTTVIHLSGAGEEGLGEDVTYDADLQRAQQAAGAVLPLAGEWTLDGFSEHLAGLDLFPGERPEHEVYRNYRRWAFESAALDLALRQAGRPLASVLGRTPRPLAFVVSLRLGEPPTFAPVGARLSRYPGLRFKLDATPSWDDALISALAATGAVAAVDFKGAYRGTVVDVPTDPALYRRVAAAFPDAWLEDPDLTVAEAAAALEPHRDRITWDAIIHGVEDILALPFPPRTVNLKPSRFGSLRALCAAYDFCAQRGIGAYGGGQFELGVGRGQIQELAALFHPDGPNDVAPAGYDAEPPADGLPSSPLPPDPTPVGFRRRAA
jgi:L-alanine-DL-glutamate epimerase-like enolase superfamily enzyme